jgi:hypothetical protein
MKPYSAWEYLAASMWLMLAGLMTSPPKMEVCAVAKVGINMQAIAMQNNLLIE